MVGGQRRAGRAVVKMGDFSYGFLYGIMCGLIIAVAAVVAVMAAVYRP